MEVGYIITWERPARGREHEALGVFADAMAFWEGKIEAGEVVSRDNYINLDGRGITIVKGDSATIQKITEGEEYRELMTRAGLCVDGFKILGSWPTGAEIDDIVVDYGKAVANF